MIHQAESIQRTALVTLLLLRPFDQKPTMWPLPLAVDVPTVRQITESFILRNPSVNVHNAEFQCRVGDSREMVEIMGLCRQDLAVELQPG